MSQPRPRVAYFSPLNPDPSGISDYSEELLPHLADLWDVHLFVHGYRPESKAAQGLPVVDCATVDPLSLQESYDSAVYQMGNSSSHDYIYDTLLRWPGMVVLHDFSLHHLIAERYLSVHRPDLYLREVRAQLGNDAAERSRRTLWGAERAPWESAPLRYPMNRRVLEAATGVVAHSDFVASWIRKAAPRLRVHRIDHHALFPPDDIRQRPPTSLDDQVLQLVIAGNLTPMKQVDVVLRSLARITPHLPLRCELVGDVSPVWDLQALARELGLGRQTRFRERVSQRELYHHLLTADLCISLRHPTVGETSGIVMRALACGRPVVVSNDGWFAELPDSVAVKVPPTGDVEDRLADEITALGRDRNRLRRMSRDAAAFAGARDPLSRARAYHAALRATEPPPQALVGRALYRVAERAREIGMGSSSSLTRRVSAHLADLTLPRPVHTPDARAHRRRWHGSTKS